MGVVEEIKTIYEKVVLEYKVIFKGGIVLIGLSLAGMVQTFPELMDLGSDARKLQFQMEEKHNVKNIEELDCDKLSEGIADCKYAKYKYFENKNALGFTSKIIVAMFYMGLFLLTVSFFAFWESAKKGKTHNKALNN